jgi:hypothetical protein
MNDNLIRGINPFQITKIGWSKFRRYDVHPYYNRLARKKFPILTRIPFVRAFILKDDSEYRFYDISQADVYIEGQKTTLRRIECKSNAEAEALYNTLNKELDDFVKSVKT